MLERVPIIMEISLCALPMVEAVWEVDGVGFGWLNGRMRVDKMSDASRGRPGEEREGREWLERAASVRGSVYAHHVN